MNHPCKRCESDERRRVARDHPRAGSRNCKRRDSGARSEGPGPERRRVARDRSRAGSRNCKRRDSGARSEGPGPERRRVARDRSRAGSRKTCSPTLWGLLMLLLLSPSARASDTLLLLDVSEGMAAMCPAGGDSLLAHAIARVGERLAGCGESDWVGRDASDGRRAEQGEGSPFPVRTGSVSHG